MKRRQWDANAKARIVLEGLQGKSVAERCNEYQINQSQYYQWCDQFPANASRAFEVHQDTRQAARLVQEKARLKPLVGELTVEVKKSDAWLA
jgi:transposase-like protein